MVRKKRQGPRKKLLYFFLNEKIHKVIKSSKAKDELIAWCYPDKKRVLYSYSQVKSNMSGAYSVIQVAKMLNRTRVSIQRYILDGKISQPQKIYSIGKRTLEKEPTLRKPMGEQNRRCWVEPVLRLSVEAGATIL